MLLGIYTNDKGEYAKLIELKNHGTTAVVVINDKSKEMAWHDFIREFKHLPKAVKDEND